MSVGTSTPVRVSAPRTDFDIDVETRRDDDDVDYSGWFCVETAPWPCPGRGCTFVALHLTAAHLIVVWPSRDDPALLGIAYSAKVAERQPRVVEYEQEMGNCIAYDAWRRLGSPIHGRAEKPDGWDDRAKNRL